MFERAKLERQSSSLRALPGALPYLTEDELAQRRDHAQRVLRSLGVLKSIS